CPAGSFFGGWIYHDWDHLHGATRGRSFGQRDANDHNAGSRIADIDNAPNAGKAGQSLDKIYTPRDIGSDQWASYFASLSPEEDFVETYKFRVLVVPDQN